MRSAACFVAIFLAALASAIPAHAAFHLMQIEQVIGGVNGDTTAQAIQLRTRASSQNFVASSRVVVVDAMGANPVLLENIASNVPNGQAGRRILLATASFASKLNATLTPDFIMDPIPSSYLPAGQLRFLDDSGTIYWSVSWGGAGYSGSTLGNTINDVNGNFGPPVNLPLSSTNTQALQFTGASADLSTQNIDQYALTAGSATFINNANVSATLVPLPDPPAGLAGDFNDDGIVDAADYTVWRNNLGTNFDLGGNGDEEGDSEDIVDAADYEYWKTRYGDVAEDPPGAGGLGSAVPEPASLLLLAALLLARPWRRRSVDEQL